MCPQPWEAGAGVEPGPRSKYSLGSGAAHSPSSFLIPGPVGVAGPRRSSAAATWDLLTVSWGTGASCQTTSPGLGPTGPADHRVLLWATSWSQIGKPRPSVGGRGAPRRLPEPEVLREVPSRLCLPLHGLEGHVPLCKPTWRSLRGSVGVQVGTVQTGLFDQRFRPMPGCRDSRQWPNRPRYMPSGPRQECHSCPWRVVTAGGAPGSQGDAWPGGCPGNWGHLPTAQGGREHTRRGA